MNADGRLTLDELRELRSSCDLCGEPISAVRVRCNDCIETVVAQWAAYEAAPGKSPVRNLLRPRTGRQLLAEHLGTPRDPWKPG